MLYSSIFDTCFVQFSNMSCAKCKKKKKKKKKKSNAKSRKGPICGPYAGYKNPYQSRSQIGITKTRLFKYTEHFTTENDNFSDKKNLIFFIFLLKTYIVGTR